MKLTRHFRFFIKLPSTLYSFKVTVQRNRRQQDRPATGTPKLEEPSPGLGHGHQRGHDLDAIPEILQAQILVFAVLVVVVVDNGNAHDRHAE